MGGIKERILEIYFDSLELSFYVFLFAVLSFGRAFSALYVNTPFFPLFVTEIFLLLNIPLLFYKYNRLIRLPKVFLIFFLLFFSFSCSYLFAGILKRNIFALRDITLCGYMLFLLIAFIHLDSLKKIKPLIVIIIFSNVINLYVGRCLLTNRYPSESLYNFLSKGKIISLSLYYGIACSFIVSFYEYIRPRAYRLLALIVLSLNVHMLIFVSKGSIWAAVSLSLAFLLLMFKGKFLRLFCFFIPTLIIVSSIILYFDFKGSPRFYRLSLSSFTNELKSYNLFFNGKPHAKLPLKEKVAPTNVTKQNVPTKLSSKVMAAPTVVTSTIQTIKPVSELGANVNNIDWRLGIWKQTLKFGLGSPLIGRGFGIYPEYKIWYSDYKISQPCPPRKGIYLDSGITPAHNHFLTIFFKLGILGLAVFLFLNFYVFVYALNYIKKCNLNFVKNLLIALLGAFVFWHTLAFLFDIIDSPPTTIFLWIIMGLIFAAVEIDKNSLRNIDA